MITVALPKGRLGKDILKLLNRKDIGTVVDPKSRKLVFEDKQNNIRFIWLKNADVITYVENGVADFGISGSDMVYESEKDVFVLDRLNIGVCKLSIAGFNKDKLFNKDIVLKVGTKYPVTSKKFFKQYSQKIKVIKLNGSVELAPLLELSDVIVDIVETGATLKENGLDVLHDMYDVSACTIANKASYRFNKEKIDLLVNILKSGE